MWSVTYSMITFWRVKPAPTASIRLRRRSAPSASRNRRGGSGCTSLLRSSAAVSGIRATASTASCRRSSAESRAYCSSSTARMPSNTGMPVSTKAARSPANSSATVRATSVSASGLPE